MKNFTRTMHERVYNVMVYVASEDKVEKLNTRRYEASKTPRVWAITFWYRMSLARF